MQVLHDTSELKLKSYYPAIYPPWEQHQQGKLTPCIAYSIYNWATIAAAHTHKHSGFSICHMATTSAINLSEQQEQVMITSATWQQHQPRT